MAVGKAHPGPVAPARLGEYTVTKLAADIGLHIEISPQAGMGLGMGAAGHVRGPVRFHQLLKACPGGFALLHLIIAQHFLTDIRLGTARKNTNETQRKHSHEVISQQPVQIISPTSHV